MLESEAEYIIKKVQSPKLNYHVFLSCIQKNSKDITDSLTKKGFRVNFNKPAEGLDNKGTIDGIVDSCSSAIILTTNYFEKPWLVFQLLISVVAAKSVIIAYELNPRYDGGHLEAYKLPRMFQHILKWKPLQMNRTYWEAFISKLCTEIRPLCSALLKNLTWAQWAWLDSELKKEGLVIGALMFDSSRDGNTANAFHSRCDGQGATLTVIENNSGNVFGGFTSQSWSSVSGYSPCECVWLFTQDSKGSFKRINIKSEKTSNGIYSYKQYGPTFGSGHDIKIHPGGQSYCTQNAFLTPVLTTTNFVIKHYAVYQVVKLVM